MSKASEYFARAARCKTLAGETIDFDVKREFEQLAEKWNDLAKQEEIDSDRVLNAPNQVAQRREPIGVVRHNGVRGRGLQGRGEQPDDN